MFKCYLNFQSNPEDRHFRLDIEYVSNKTALMTQFEVTPDKYLS